MRISIRVSKANYERLKRLKEQLGVGTINDVISILLNNYEQTNLGNLWKEIEEIKKLLNQKVKFKI